MRALITAAGAALAAGCADATYGRVALTHTVVGYLGWGAAMAALVGAAVWLLAGWALSPEVDR